MPDLQDPKLEWMDHFANTSLFALNVLRRRGTLTEMNLLSIACRLPHLADYLSIFRSVHHNTMVTTRLVVPPEKFPSKLTFLQSDFFDLSAMDIDCVISHAAIHCFNDTRYGNTTTSAGWAKPYQVPAKIRQIAGDRTLPTIVSIAVNQDEAFINDNAHLSHDKFITAFEKAGFKLQEYFFDYACGGIPQVPQYLDYEYRRRKTLPPKTSESRDKDWVVGNYYFA